MTSNDSPVTVIGLGRMGEALAGALLDAGHPTTVWNRSPAKADDLVARGATRAATPADAVAASPLAIVCVLDYDAVREILEPVGEAVAGRTLVNLTSGTPDQVRATAAWAAQRGATYLDGKIMAIPPAIGTPAAFLLLSGPRDAFDTERPALEALGAATYFGAEPSLASGYDLALLDAMYATLVGFIHAAALMRAQEVDATTFLPYASQWLTTVLGFLPDFARAIDAGQYTGHAASLDMQTVGLNHIVHASRAAGIDAELPLYVKALIDREIAAGRGDNDFVSVIESLRAA